MHMSMYLLKLLLNDIFPFSHSRRLIKMYITVVAKIPPHTNGNINPHSSMIIYIINLWNLKYKCQNYQNAYPKR